MDIKDFQHLPIVNKEVKTKNISFEFQEICLQLEEYFGKEKIIWILPHQVGVTNNLLRYALKECKQRDKPFIKYFLKIITNQLKKRNETNHSRLRSSTHK